METFQASLSGKLSDALAAAGLAQAGGVTPATDARFGDYQTNAALVLSKQLGENPHALAQRILDAYGLWDVCDPPTIAGAGFTNFTLRPETIAAQTAQLLHDERLGVAKAAEPKRIVIDFGSPNVAKPMHVGHIRSILGDALARIASFLGHDVIRDNPRYSRAGGKAGHHSQERWWFQLRDDRYRDRGLSNPGSERRYGLARRKSCTSNKSSRSRAARVTRRTSVTLLLAASSATTAN